MLDNNKLETISNLFEGNEIRSVWDSEKEDYYFSVVDVIKALTDSNIPKRYWSDLKRKLIEEGSQLYENIVQLKMIANDGKLRDNMTDVEVALADLGEIATRELAKKHRPYGLRENRKITKAGGEVAKTARNDLEQKLGESVISSENALNYKYIEENKKLDSKKEED